MKAYTTAGPAMGKYQAQRWAVRITRELGFPTQIKDVRADPGPPSCGWTYGYYVQVTRTDQNGTAAVYTADQARSLLRWYGK